MKIMIVTDAWEPQVNGVVRTLKTTAAHLQELGHEVQILSPLEFRSVPCPTYPEIALALTTPAQVAQRIQDFDPDAFYTVEDVRHARDIPTAYATAATGAGKSRMPV